MIEKKDRAAFVGALAARALEGRGLDPRGAEIVADELRSDDRPDRRQRPSRLYPGLTARPWHEVDEFAWTKGLLAAWSRIRDEALALREQGRFATDPLSAGLADGAWNEFRFYTEGHPNAAGLEACPHTAAAIAEIPGAASAGLVYFSAVGPRTHIRPHCGPHNARLRCQLGLVSPEGCELTVGGETRWWQAGEAVIFDDSFEHELWNRSEETRIVLIVDVWHPDLSPSQIVAIRLAESDLVRHAYDLAQSWAGSGEIDSVGSVK